MGKATKHNKATSLQMEMMSLTTVLPRCSPNGCGEPYVVLVVGAFQHQGKRTVECNFKVMGTGKPTVPELPPGAESSRLVAAFAGLHSSLRHLKRGVCPYRSFSNGH